MKIVIKNLEFDTIIGVLKEERINKQKVIVNCEIKYDYKNSYLDYAEVVEIIKKILRKKEYEVIEDALLFITKTLKERFRNIKKITLEILKPDILDDCIVGAEILKKY
jgi:dihydroneopterin aldolase